ncbi:hypothetical protein [Cellulomonas soli]
MAYVAAVNGSAPAWGVLSERLDQQGFTMYLDDLQAQVDADATFVHALRAIDFPESAQPAARAFMLAVMKYDMLMARTVRAGDFSPSFPTIDDAVNAQRARRSGDLRDALGLPDSNCILYRP